MEWATIHGHDGKDPMKDYMSLCRKCHAAYDDLAGVLSRAKTGVPRGPHKAETRQKMREAAQQRWDRWRAMTPEEQAPARERMSEGQRRRYQAECVAAE